ncbi:hypothetical protein BHE74_00050468 [Ensete ventricosum]|nr:hypothetical protein GW17_00045796 [Ensete ventricosum]RWW43833.1 hypothetical protein BHE74_00050468 [Ensete ventricosum]
MISQVCPDVPPRFHGFATDEKGDNDDDGGGGGQEEEEEEEEEEADLRLGSSVHGRERERRQYRRGCRSDINHRASPPPEHPWQDGARDPRRRLHVDPHDAPPQLLLHLVEEHGVGVRRPGAVHQDTDVQPLDLRLEPIDPFRRVSGEVHDNGLDHGSRVCGLDAVGDLLELGGVAAGQDEVESTVGELEGDGLADAVGGAGDEGP